MLTSIKQIHAHMKKVTKLVFTRQEVSGAFPQSNFTMKQFQTKWCQVLKVSRQVSRNLDTILMYKSKKIISFFLGPTNQIFYCGTNKVAPANHSSKSGSNSLGVNCCKVSRVHTPGQLDPSSYPTTSQQHASLVHRVDLHFHIQPYFLSALQNITPSLISQSSYAQIKNTTPV